MLNVDKAYMMHYLPLGKRRESIDRLPFDVKLITYEPYGVTYTSDEKSWYAKCDVPFRELKKSEISLAYKHMQTYFDIAINEFDSALILEDDAVIVNNFVNRFNDYLSRTPDDWDLIFIGSGCDLRIRDTEPGKVAYLKSHPASKCTDSYCIRGSAAALLSQNIIHHSLPIDFELNYWMEKLNFRVYWWEPPLVMQGSQIGLYESSIQ
jgi:GR25 family glycosyltransferase involved in LPS biosynthesis